MTTDQDQPPTSGGDMSPAQALDLYLDTRRGEVSKSTLRAHKYRLNHFVRWCEDVREIEDLSVLTGQKIHEYRLWRREDGDLNTVSLHTQLSTLRVFLKFCESIELAPKGLHEKLLIPTLESEEERSDDALNADRADAILEWLSTYEYASFDHVLFRLLWRTGMRIGAAQSLDVADYDRAEARLEFVHRPQGGTSLKNGKAGQRIVALTSQTVVLLNDYLERTRPDVTDKNGRKPLLATERGRPSTSTLRRHVYRITQPCQRQNECPHGREMADCPDIGYASTKGCPSSLGPHAIRTGSITHFLREDVPPNVVSERMDVSEKIIEKHYDVRTEVTKSEQRRRYFDDT